MPVQAILGLEQPRGVRRQLDEDGQGRSREVNPHGLDAVESRSEESRKAHGKH